MRDRRQGAHQAPLETRREALEKIAMLVSAMIWRIKNNRDYVTEPIERLLREVGYPVNEE